MNPHQDPTLHPALIEAVERAAYEALEKTNPAIAAAVADLVARQQSEDMISAALRRAGATPTLYNICVLAVSHLRRTRPAGTNPDTKEGA